MNRYIGCSIFFVIMSHYPLIRSQDQQRILFSNGCWWLLDPELEKTIHLDPKFGLCNWNVGRLCKSLVIEKRTFTRLVEDSLGIAAKRWLREIRIVAACHLLREEGKIDNVARTLGFRYDSDFSHEFKKLVGVSPSHYRKAENLRSEGFSFY